MTPPVRPESMPTAALSMDEASSELEALLSLEEDGPSDEPKDKPAPKIEQPDDANEDEDEQPDPDADADAPDADPNVQPDPDADPDAEDVDPDAQGDAPAPKLHRVKVDGQEIEVSEAELKRSYSFEAHQTRKSQALAAKEKEIAEQMQATRVEREKYAAVLTQAEGALQGQLPTDIDWEKLRAEDPIAFAEEYAAYSLKQDQLAVVRAERDAVERKMAEDAATVRRERVSAEGQKLLEVVTEWKDPTVRKAEKKELVEYATGLGYSTEDVAAIDDHRALVILRKAMLHDRAVAAKKATKDSIREKVVKPAPLARPNAAAITEKPRVTSDLTRANKRLAQTGSREDAADAVKLLLEAEERYARRQR